MCGIAGVFSYNSMISTRVVEDMSQTLIHRGPDGDGLWASDRQDLIFAHRRLSIIDLTNHAAQPMQTQDQRYVITYNGEIYNYKKLRQECEKLGSQFYSHSDTEVILECYRYWGCEAFKHFIGMWALALYDKASNELVFSRDPFGIKPLYYGFTNGNLFFASEPKALRQACKEFSLVDDVSVKLFIENSYLERGDWTFFEKIKRFPHAHFSRISLDKPITEISFTPYWSPRSTERKISFNDAAAELSHLIKNSIKLHLRSDVPVGACLSGGIDSTAIVSIGSRLEQGRSQFTTFTTHYPDHPELDESLWAKKVIKFANAKSYFAHPTFEMFMSEFDHLLYAQDEPFASTSIFAQYAVFKKIQTTDIKVVLDGQGPDEMLGGYHGFVPHYLNDLVNRLGIFSNMLEMTFLYKRLGRYTGTDIYKSAFKQKLKALLKPLSLASNKAALNLLPYARESYADRWAYLSQSPETFNGMMSHLTCDSNIPHLLRYEDRNSMHHSIEARVPFLEKGIVDFCLSLPFNYKIHKGYTKAVLREALKGLIPEDVRKRTDKLGFPAPEVAWLKRAFSVDVPGAGSQQWRELCVSKWKKQLK